MICYSILGEIIGPDLLASFSGTHLSFSCFGNLGFLPGFLHIQKARTQNPHRLGFVLELRPLILTTDHELCGKMDDTDSRMGGVHPLTSRARCTECINP